MPGKRGSAKGALHMRLPPADASKKKVSSTKRKPVEEEDDHEDELEGDGTEEEAEDSSSSSKDNDDDDGSSLQLLASKRKLERAASELAEIESRIAQVEKAKRRRQQELLALGVGKVCRIGPDGLPVPVSSSRRVSTELTEAAESDGGYESSDKKPKVKLDEVRQI